MMPVTPTYPGVYIQEIPSGVRTISGVSTSVTAFVGAAKRGPINRAVRIFNFGEYERNFGGLVSNYELGYAVRQFFQNGGGEAWVIRLALNATAATATLVNENNKNVLELTARDEGKAGDGIVVRIDHDTENPASTFNLTLSYVAVTPSESRTESFPNLTLNSRHARYAVDVIRDGSQLVTAERLEDGVSAVENARGVSRSGPLVDENNVLLNVPDLVDMNHNRLRISVDGATPVEVVLPLSNDEAGQTPEEYLLSICAAIQADVEPYHEDFKCEMVEESILMKSPSTGENSRVRVLPGLRNDVSARLKLGLGAGGTETDAAATMRPSQVPARATLVSGNNVTKEHSETMGEDNTNSLRISLDGFGPDTFVLPDGLLNGLTTIAARLDAIASELQAQVRARRPANPAYAGFTAEPFVVSGPHNNGLRLRSGTRGSGSTIEVSADDGDDLADKLHLSGVGTRPTDFRLAGGEEDEYTANDEYGLFIADRSARRGIYAMEAVDIFNLMCLPGVTNSGVLADAVAYCQERRAFLVVDAPSGAKTPDAMAELAAGTALPKSNHAAVYFPWVWISDPLKGGRPRLSAPSGTMAGVYARTDGNRGIWKAPAGTDATLAGVQKADYLLTDPQNGVINPLGVNAIRILPGIGAVAWGARTLRGDDRLADEYKYVPVRRLALYIEESLYRGTQWVVFEGNDEPLWSQIRLNIGAFMHTLFRKGAFAGRTPRDAYLVKCDSETTTQDDVNRGIVNILVGFAPLKPAEFVIIQIQQLAGQVET
jgi:uncharacterized protein